MKMRNECSTSLIGHLTILYFLLSIVEGKPVGHHYDLSRTIKTLRHDIHRVLHFIDHLSEDVQNNEIANKDDKGRSEIPYFQGQFNHLMADESVIKETANKAAKAVADTAKATLKTQKGVKQIAKGLVELKKCLERFEKTITL